jgi:alpha-galactosidase
MRRSEFIKISSVTLAATMFNRLTLAVSSQTTLMHLPDEVWVQSYNQWFKLKPTKGNVYTYRDIKVRLNHTSNAQSVFVQSPTLTVQDILLKWKYTPVAGSKYLSDSWERTYGDVAWKSNDGKLKSPWYLLVHDLAQTNCFGVKTGCYTFCSWYTSPNTIELLMDARSAGLGVQLGTHELHAADIVTTKSTTGESPFRTAQRFCHLMCERPRLPKQPVYGINDWYYAYGNNSASLIKEQTALMADLVTDTVNRPFSVIDAGWAAYSPLLPGDCCWQDDFSRPNDKFKDMQQVADDITKLGMRPGLWTRPLCAKYNDSKTVLLPTIPGRQETKNPVLDPTIPENLERIKGNIITYKKWGFELVKHDFSTFDITGKWGFDMGGSITTPGWSFYDKTKTTAEVMLNLYHAIREAAGDMYLIGCDTMSHLSAGVFEMNRVGDDTSGKEWARTRKMGVNTLGFRIPQHNAFYATDGDCVGLTKDIEWKKNKQWMQLLTESGTPLLISAQPDALGTEQKAFIKECFAKAAKIQPTGEPLDWLTNPLPAKWKLNNREVIFNWD